MLWRFLVIKKFFMLSLDFLQWFVSCVSPYLPHFRPMWSDHKVHWLHLATLMDFKCEQAVVLGRESLLWSHMVCLVWESCKGAQPCNGWHLPAVPLHSPWSHPEWQQALAPYVREPYVQFYGYKGNYFNCDSCYGLDQLICLDQLIMKDPHTPSWSPQS